MSKVCRAYDRELGRTVCLKLLDKEKTKKFEARFAGLKKPPEGEICMRLRHENIVQTFEHGLTTEGEPYLVMEWVEGLGLNYLVETPSAAAQGQPDQLPQPVVRRRAVPARQQVPAPRPVPAERDGGQGRRGEADRLRPDDPVHAGVLPAAATAPARRTILAPEIIKRKTTDHRVDLFALGVTAYEVFTGQLPWERSVSSEETFRRRLNQKPRTAKELNPQVEDDLSAVLLRSIERDPADRYPTATAFKDALAKVEKQDY